MNPTRASIESAVADRLNAAGIPEEALDLADSIIEFTGDISPSICLLGDVVSVFITATMITEIMDQDGDADVDGVDFSGVASLLRDAADKYEAIGKRVAN